MIDVNDLIYDTLSNIATPSIPVFFDEADLTSLSSEFITFDRIYGDEQNFADNIAHHEYSLYRVNYYGISKERRQAVMELIKTAMKEAGFYVQSHNINIPREAGASYYGAYSEFSYWAVI